MTDADGQIDVLAVRANALVAYGVYAADRITLHLTGDAGMESADAVEGVLTRLHAEALQRATTEVAVDLRELEFMNSSCLARVITWITTVQESSAPYRIRFLSDPKLLWQRRSLRALQSFAPDLITVEPA